MDVVLDADIEKAIEDVCQTYESICTHGIDDLKNSEDFIKMGELIFKLKQEYLRCDKALVTAQNESTVEDFKRVYEKECEKSDKRIQNLPEFKNFKGKIEKITNESCASEMPTNSRSAGEGFQILQSEINIYDPLTKLPMIEPVRNTLCGHHYDKSTVLAAIKECNKLRCPVAGCGNTTPITSNQLILDHNMKLSIQQILSNMEED